VPAIVIVPVRDPVPVFAAIEYPRVPLPVPLDPDVIVIHVAVLVAVHVQVDAAAVTPTDPVVAPAPGAALAGDSVNVQATPACVTVNVWPAIVSVPVRGVALVFAATEYVTAPFPAPVLPPVIVSHDALLEALHAHVPPDAVTLTLALDAPEAGDTLVGDSVNVHATPACVTVKVCPAIVSVPVRDDVPAFAATE
jgi:hypothetical protein